MPKTRRTRLYYPPELFPQVRPISEPGIPVEVEMPEEIIEVEGVSRPAITERTENMIENQGVVAGDIESPTREANGDDLADLFKAPRKDDPDIRTDDLTSVTDEDVFGDGGADMSDILEVSEAEVMGDDEEPPAPKPVNRVVRYKRTNRRYIPPSSMGGVRY